MPRLGNHITFGLALGQIEFIANSRMCHSRGTFENHDELDRRLIRIFLRDKGKRGIIG